ncbi:MAG: 3'-5' exonuclease [Patescibacteria group bacterium]
MIALDIESSGVDPVQDSILSLGAVDLESPANRFYGECHIWDGAHVNDEALLVNGFTHAAVRDSSKQSEIELVQAFLSWTESVHDRTLVGQNPSFDRDFLIAACYRGGIPFPLAHRTLDTHTLAYMHMVKRGVTPPFDAEKHHTKLTLDAALKYVGIPEEPKPHNALTGALSHAEVASRLLFEKPLLPEFSAYPIPYISI